MINTFCYSIYFNPRPREEGDENEEINNDYQDISIHALVKRATNYEQK